MSTEIALINIADQSILSAHHDGDVLIPMKQLSEGLGLPWSAQHERINETPILAEGIRVIRIPSPSGGSQEALCLPVRLAFAWLLTVPVKRIRNPDVRLRILNIQRESFDAIYDYWTKGSATNPRFNSKRGVTRREMLATLDRLTNRDDPDARAFLTTLHNQDRAAIGLPPIAEQPRQPGLFDGQHG